MKSYVCFAPKRVKPFAFYSVLYPEVLSNMDTPLDRFINAHENYFAAALSEIRSGKKRTHWMWFIFPQLSALGSSPTSKHYGITDLEEAYQFLHHAVLGKNLVKVSSALYELNNKTAEDIFGYPDYLKLRSSMTLFSLVRNTSPIFAQIISKYFDNKPDPITWRMLGGKRMDTDGEEKSHQ